MKNLFRTLLDLLITRLLGVTIGGACAVVFGIGLFGSGAVLAEYSQNEDDRTLELMIAAIVIIVNLGAATGLATLWRRLWGVQSWHFDIPPRVWFVLAAVSQLGGFASGFRLFAE